MRTGRLAAGVAMCFMAACSEHVSAPTPPIKTAPPAPPISIPSIAIIGQAQTRGGYSYRVVVQIRESGGTTATISSIDLTFLNGSAPVVTAHFDRPISDTSNQVPANATVDSRPLTVADDNSSHPYATTAQVKVAYVDGQSNGTVTGSADVPPAIQPLPPPTATLAGVISNQSTGRGIVGDSVRNAETNFRTVLCGASVALSGRGLDRVRAPAVAGDDVLRSLDGDVRSEHRAEEIELG